MSLGDKFHTYIPRFVTNRKFTNKLAQDAEKYPLLPSPQAPWTKSLTTESGEKLPQIIAHRGYRAKYPENSMLAFEKAIANGAHALETDLHLTKDNVIVLSHDVSLKRCFGKDKLVVDCEWSEIQSLRSLAEPHEPMPRLLDLLEYLAQPGLKDIWLLLDIKMDDDPDLMIQSISEAIAAAPPSPSKPWNQRIVLGIWAIKYLEPCAKYLPDYSLSNIGFSTIYARNFLTPKTPNVTFNMLIWTLMMPVSGPRFITNAHLSGRAVYAWTVNEESAMKWCMKHQLDGVITDDVEKLAQVRSQWQKGNRSYHVRIRTRAFTIWIWLLTVFLGFLIRRRLEKRSVRKIKLAK